MGKEERTKFAFQAHFSTFRGGSGTNLNLKIDYRVTISSYVNLPGSNTFKVCLLIIFFVACVACGFVCAWMSGKVWRRMELNACFAASNSPPPPPPTPLSPAKQTAGKAGYDFCIQRRWMLKDHQAPSLYPRRCAIRDLKQRHFWETQVNRKCLDAKDVLVWFLYTCRDNLTENLGKTTAQECKKTTSGWRASLKNAFA